MILKQCHIAKIYPILTVGKDEFGAKKFSTIGECPICLSGPRVLLINKLCNHGGCHQCMYNYLKSVYGDISKYPISCFAYKCDELLNYHTIVQKVLKSDELSKFDNLNSKAAIKENDINFISCDTCGIIMEIPESHLRIKVQCMNPNCDTYLCVKCLCKWHDNMTCEDYQRSIEVKFENKQNEKEFNKLIEKEELCKCPRCGIVIEKTGGCNHMTHAGCDKGVIVNWGKSGNNDGKDKKGKNGKKRTDFCYICGKCLIHKQDGSGWRYDVAGKLHFPEGVFKPCIYAKR